MKITNIFASLLIFFCFGCVKNSSNLKEENSLIIPPKFNEIPTEELPSQSFSKESENSKISQEQKEKIIQELLKQSEF